MWTVRKHRLLFIDFVKIPLTSIMFFLLYRTIPSHGNTADISLTVLHRNFLGVDEFLGQVCLPLRDFDVYERPKSKWFPLKCKPGQNKNEYRGEIEVSSDDSIFFSHNYRNETQAKNLDCKYAH